VSETARLRVRHVTGFIYDGAARASYNEARMTPPTTPRQRVLDARLATAPAAVQSTYRDYFGTIVTTFDLQESHHRLVVTSEATVETTGPAPLPTSWRPEQLTAPDVADRYAEYLVATPRTDIGASVRAEARERFGRLDAHDAVAATIGWVRERVRYVTGSTNVTSTAAEVWAQGEGVCQDLAHVSVALLRGLAIPARYVSGYLHVEPGANEVAQLGQSHAWVEYFSGDWVGVDPTNAGAVGVDHVVVAHGREYGDVPPLKGIYHGEPSRHLGVEVQVARLD
jgi:transglutaminase-like putative cysteine protease